MGQNISIAISFTSIICGAKGCGCLFALPAEMQKKLADDGGYFWCPKGHRISYTDTMVSRLEKKLAATQRNSVWLRERGDRLLGERESAQRSASAYKGHLSRVKRRVSHGVCPCCNRTFKDLARHMQGKHPDYAGAVATPAPGGAA